LLLKLQPRHDSTSDVNMAMYSDHTRLPNYAWHCRHNTSWYIAHIDQFTHIVQANQLVSHVLKHIHFVDTHRLYVTKRIHVKAINVVVKGTYQKSLITINIKH